jgi:hypothetical protein
VHDKVDVPLVPRVILEGLIEQASPVEGDTVREMVTLPLNPSSGATVTVEVPVAPVTRVTWVGFVLTVKSVTVTVTVVV